MDPGTFFSGLVRQIMPFISQTTPAEVANASSVRAVTAHHNTESDPSTSQVRHTYCYKELCGILFHCLVFSFQEKQGWVTAVFADDTWCTSQIMATHEASITVGPQNQGSSIRLHMLCLAIGQHPICAIQKGLSQQTFTFI